MADKGIIFSAPMVRALLDGRKTQTRRLAKFVRSDGDGWHIRSAGGGMFGADEDAVGEYCPDFAPYAPGDRLYMREQIQVTGEGVRYAMSGDDDPLAYDIDWGNVMHPGRELWLRKFNPDRAVGIPSIHMPRWASRLWLEVTDVRVQRLQDISEADAIAEGAQFTDYGLSKPRGEASIDGGRSWFAMPGMKQPGWSMTEASRPEDSLWTATSAFANIWSILHTTEGERWQDNPWIVAVTFDVHPGNIDGGQK